MIAALWATLVELAPWLLLGSAIAGAVHVLLPPGFVRQHLGGRGGVAKAVALGVPMPLCSCGVIPTGIGLKREGASDGASVAFIVSTPQTGVDSILVSAGMLGWPFALLKVAAAVVTGLVAGWTVDALSSSTDVELEPEPVVEQAPSLQRAIAYADELLRSIWGWLVFGVVVSAALQVMVSPGALSASVAGLGALAGLAVLALSLPLYVCATASVPIAAGLLHAGLPPSAALVFLLAGPASNLATMGAIRGAFGGRVLAVYLATVAIGALGFGWLFDAVLPAMGAHGAAHAEGGVLSIVAAVALLGMLLRYAFEDVQGWMRRTGAQEDVTTELGVDGLTCQGCARKLDRFVCEVDGVQSTEVSVDDGRLVVFGAANLDAVVDAVQRAGFRPVER